MKYWDEELETVPWDRVRQWQVGRMGQWASELRQRSPFYRDKFATIPQEKLEFSHADELSRFPFTTKDDLRRAQEAASPQTPLGANQGVPTSELVQILASSGTSGRPVHYGLTSSDLHAWSHGVAAMFFTAGVRRHELIAHLTRLPIVAGGLPYADGLRKIGAGVVWLGGLPTERLLLTIKRLGIPTVTTTTSFHLYLAEQCERLTNYKPEDFGIRRLIGGGEPGLQDPILRQEIRGKWNATHVRDAMGLTDVMAGMWSECDDESGMHFTAQRHVAVELVDPANSKPLEWLPETRGEAVYTTFSREATPVFRFRSGDLIEIVDDSCVCGRTSPKVACIDRIDDMLIYKGMNVYPGAIRGRILREFGELLHPHIRIWKETKDQIRFDGPIPIDVEVVPTLDEAYWSHLKRKMEESIRSHLQVRVDVSLVPEGTIPRSQYKSQLVYARNESID